MNFNEEEIMQSISCYDIEEKRIEELCAEYDVSEAELVEALIAAVDDGTVDLSQYL